MFIIELTYKKAMSDVEEYLEAHRAFLDEQYAAGTFVASGPKDPRDGGVILAGDIPRSVLEKIIQKDPFYIQEISQFKITKRSPNFTY
ncbi:MAG: GTP cyclohydrolase [Rhizobacter sp.]|nr:GTP cyclohydrolase [Bacteriovorax sp.]